MATQLETYIREQRKTKDVLLMSQIVVGDPSFDASEQIVAQMVESGVDLIELQIPFSEPIADGPVILQANARALANGATVERAFEFAEKMARTYHIPFLFMTYYNILYRYGVTRFVEAMKVRGLQGAIVPDLPPEEAEEFVGAMAKHGMAPVFIFSPNTPMPRMRTIAELSQGFIYCVARKGVTGADTDFGSELDAYLARCASATSLPLALGFGVKDANDIRQLAGKVDIAVVGSATIRLVEREGVQAVGPFIRSLRSALT